MSNTDLAKFSDIELMIGNMYGEARFIEGDVSDDVREYICIGCVVINRVNDPRWPNTVKEVILQRKQFSWTNPGDPSRDKVIAFLTTGKETKTYKQLKIYAQAILDNRVIDFSHGAQYYVARWLYEREQKQDWIDTLKITAIYGGHVFLWEPRTDG